MQNDSLANLSLQQLKNAVAIREKIEGLENELGRIIGGQAPTTGKARRASLPGKRRLSAAGRAKLSAMMKARWANRRKQKSPRAAKSTTQKANGKPTQRGQLKGQIIRKLKAAGRSGIGIKDLAAKLGKSYGSTNVWFHTTAKGVKEIKKVAPGRFAWVS
jgi:hypothetical protein